MARRSGSGSKKYLRLTGLWPAQGNSTLFTGRCKTEQVEDLIKRCEEALENDAPLLFSLWDNIDKKRNRKDPDFNLQCFVGDSEEKPRERGRGSRDNDRGSRRSSQDDNDDDNQDDNNDDNQDDPESEEKEERGRKPSKRTGREEKEERSSRSKGKRDSSGW